MEEVIKINDLTKVYPGKRGIFNLTLSVNKGEVFALVGTNGSGKTTTIRNMMGFLKPTSGSVEVFGIDSFKESIENKKRIGYVPGDISFPDVGSGRTFLNDMAKALEITNNTRTNKLIELFKLDIDAPLKRMSKGMKQKTALVACFMSDADLYILDEPTTGLDPLMIDSFIELIKLEKSRGKTVFMSSHIFKEIEAVSDKCAIIHNGKLLKIVDTKNFNQDFELIYQFEFVNTDDYIKFNELGYNIAKNNQNINLVRISISKKDLNKLIKDLANMKLKYFKQKPIGLNEYFEEIVEEEEYKNVQ